MDQRVSTAMCKVGVRAGGVRVQVQYGQLQPEKSAGYAVTSAKLKREYLNSFEGHYQETESSRWTISHFDKIQTIPIQNTNALTRVVIKLLI